jgi:hypothetical protein
MASSGRFVDVALRLSGGLLVWGAHLGAVYAWAATVCARGWRDRELLGMPVVPFGVMAATVPALLLAGLLLAAGVRDLRRQQAEAEGRRFIAAVTAWTAGFSLVAITWTALVPGLVVPPCAADARVGSLAPALGPAAWGAAVRRAGSPAP